MQWLCGATAVVAAAVHNVLSARLFHPSALEEFEKAARPAATVPVKKLRLTCHKCTHSQKGGVCNPSIGKSLVLGFDLYHPGVWNITCQRTQQFINIAFTFTLPCVNSLFDQTCFLYS